MVGNLWYPEMLPESYQSAGAYLTIWGVFTIGWAKFANKIVKNALDCSSKRPQIVGAGTFSPCHISSELIEMLPDTCLLPCARHPVQGPE